MSASSHPVIVLRRRPKLSRGRLWLFRGLTMLLIWGAIELASLILWLWMPLPMREARVFNDYLTSVAVLGTERGPELEALHPYLGWVINPDAGNIPMQSDRPWKANELGFVDDGPSVRHKSPDTLIIGVLGGSVAQQMTTIGEVAFRKKLESSPTLGGRKVEIVRLAMSGYKQPQQLMALNYVMALGAEFDVVVNIDGYNETSLAISENAESNTFIAYPRMWSARLQDVVDPRLSSLSNRLVQLRGARQSRAKWFEKSYLRHSPAVSLLWANQDRHLKSQHTSLALELTDFLRKEGHGFARQGPHQKFSTKPEMYQHTADLWKNCSRQMHDLCRGKRIPYLHVLQPNQYHDGSKQLSTFEEEHCFAKHERHGLVVRDMYPQLIEAGKDLHEEGVAFCDFTMLFADVTDTIYSDYFCHYNTQGTNMLAEAVAEHILDVLQLQSR